MSTPSPQEVAEHNRREREAREPPDNAHLLLLSAADAAVSWWRHKKPRGWSVMKHLQNPCVNCATNRENRLARAAARWYAIQKGIKP